MSALDEYRKVKDRLHELRYCANGKLSVRIERSRIQSPDFSVSEHISLHENNPLFGRMLDVLDEHLAQLRAAAEKEARELLEELKP